MNPRDALWPTYAPPEDLVFTHGLGTELYTADGRAYLDFISGIAVTSFGHSHPALVSVLNEQAQKLWHLSNVFRVPEAERLSRRFADHSFADRVFFANSGTEAVEAGIKAVRGYQASTGNTQRHRIVGFNGSFHGRTLAAVAAAGNEAHTSGFIPFDYGFDQAPWEDLDAVEALVSGETAGILIEPVQGEGGIVAASESFLRGLREICNRHGLLLMFDEVQCGMGRTGELFAYQHSSVQPDVMALAKGMGAGFPVGACLVTEAVGQAMVVGKHGSTFGGNPLAMAVGNTVLDLMLEPDFMGEVVRKGELLSDGLAQLCQQFPDQLGGHSGRGLMRGLRCVMPNTELLVKLRGEQLLVGKAGGNTLRLLPPLNVQDAEITRALDIIESTVRNWS